MTRPVLLVVDDDAQELQVVQSELAKRYGSDYDVICTGSPVEALHKLQTCCDEQVDVPLLLSDLWMPEMTGIEFLTEARNIYPKARRCLLINWGDRSAAEPILQAMSMSEVQAYVAKPLRSPDETFHRFVTESLQEWAEDHRPGRGLVQIVGEQWSRRCHELRDLLDRNSVPHNFYDTDSERGSALMRRLGLSEGECPVAILADGTVLKNPTNSQLGDALQTLTMLDISSPVEERTFDVVVVGAGPAGLSAAVYGASEGLETLVVEREAIGGQAGTSSLVRNYLGFPTGISGNDLAERAYHQAWTFGAHFLIAREVTNLTREDGHLLLALSDGRQVRSRAVILATGAAYRRLAIPELEAFVGAGVFYGAAVSEARAMTGQQVYVVGGGNSAGQSAMHLAKYASHVTLLVRASSLEKSMSEYLITELDADETITVRLNTQVTDGGGDYRLRWLCLEDRNSGRSERVEAGAIFVLIGAAPHTDWLPPAVLRDKGGYILTGQDLPAGGLPGQRAPFPLETSMTGVFAAGDVRHRSVKRVASAVGEGSIAIAQVHQYLAGV